MRHTSDQVVQWQRSRIRSLTCVRPVDLEIEAGVGEAAVRPYLRLASVRRALRIRIALGGRR